MALTRAEKDTELQELEAALEGVETAILVDYRGLNVPEVTELRRQVRAARARYRVVKNTLAKRVIQRTAFATLDEHFRGATAVAYTGDDPVALAKVLTTFAKTAPSLTIKAAIVQGRTVAAAQVGELAALPGKAELYARLLGVLQGPMVQLVSVLNAVPRDLVNVLVQAERKKKDA